jgi:predicted RNase H-like HicB family nuclease
MHKIILYPGEDGYWVVECPSLPGCVSQGKTKAEARANIREAIEGYEAALEKIESDPKFIEMMKRSDEDIRARRFFTQAEAERRIKKKNAMFSRADKDWEEGKLQSAFRQFLALANAGDRAAQLNVGYFYDLGIGTRCNKVLALYWYRKAYRRGDAAAANNIATIWRDKHKPQRSLAWFRRAVRLGDDGANLGIAKLYLQNGSNLRKAFTYLTKVCQSDRVSEGEKEEAMRLLKTAKKQLRQTIN